jgi:hypothetical protein
MKNNQGERESSARISESFNVLRTFWAYVLSCFTLSIYLSPRLFRLCPQPARLAKGWNVSSMYWRSSSLKAENHHSVSLCAQYTHTSLGTGHGLSDSKRPGST